MQLFVDRRHDPQRTPLETHVRILSPGEQRAIVASTRNISEQGMFIEASELCAVDDEILCDVSLPALQRHLPLRGRVAWVRLDPRPGMGIQFVDLAEPERSLLRQLMTRSEQARQHVKHVKVQFESLPAPIKARATRTPEGLVLYSALPFLRLSSSVVVYPREGEEDSWTGVLEEVSLVQKERSRVPELQLLVKPQPAAETAETAEEKRASTPAIATTRIATPLVASLSEAPAPALPQQEESSAVGPRSAAWRSQLLRLEPEVAYSLSDAAPHPGSWRPPPAAVAAPAASTAAGSPDPSVTQRVRPLRRSSPAWLWLAAVLLVGITLASLAYTGSYRRLSERLRQLIVLARPRPAASPMAARQNRSLVALPTVARVEGPAPTPPTPSMPAPLAKAAPPLSSPPWVTPEASGMPTVHLLGGTPVLVVPLEGSTRGAVHYALAQPGGLVVNLPAARPRVAFGEYPLRGAMPFRRLWLHRRDSGLHLRVLFSGKLPAHKLRILQDEVQIALENSPSP